MTRPCAEAPPILRRAQIRLRVVLIDRKTGRLSDQTPDPDLRRVVVVVLGRVVVVVLLVVVVVVGGGGGVGVATRSSSAALGMKPAAFGEPYPNASPKGVTDPSSAATQ
jgi:hypothetical protein